MTDFKIGDRVVFSTPGMILSEAHGTVCALSLDSLGIVFDETIGPHNCGGACKAEHGMWVSQRHFVHETPLSFIEENDLMEVLTNE